MNILFSRCILLISIISTPYTIFSQDCQCSDLLEELISKVQTNYAGYVHHVKEQKDSIAYLKLKSTLRSTAGSLSYRDCYTVLNQYVSYFNDGHLFVTELPRVSAQQSDSLEKLVQHLPVTDQQLADLRTKKNGDPLEGIWRDKNQVLAIIKTAPGKFAGVIIESNNKKWVRGMVKMEVEQQPSGGYFITIRRGDFAAVRFSGVRLYKNTMLPFGAYRFTKEAPAHPELQYVHTTDPTMPFFKQLDPKTLLITVPSALIDPKIMDSVLLSHEALIKSTEHLIIDIRSNLGGNFIWWGLSDIANTKEYADPKKKGEEDFLMLASNDNADYFNNISSFFRQTKDSAGIAYYDNLIARIRSNTGKTIGFSFFNSQPDTSKQPVSAFPKKIALLTDRGTASAGESFLLSLRANSSKLTVYGDNTYGMIDYMNINTKLISCGNNTTYYYGYPTFFSHTTKEKPINKTGIKPDVYIPKGVPDWIEWVRKNWSNK